MNTSNPGTQSSPQRRTHSGQTRGGRGSWSAAPNRHNARLAGRVGHIAASLVVSLVALALVSCGEDVDEASVLGVSSTTSSTSSTTTVTATPTTAPNTSTAITTTLTRSELPEVVDRWVEALLAGDAAAVARCYAEDGVWVDHGHPAVRELHHGAIEGGLSAAMGYLTLTEMTLLTAVRTGDAILTEWRWSGTSSNHSRAADDQTPFTAEVQFLFTFDGDLIGTSELSYDYGSVFN